MDPNDFIFRDDAVEALGAGVEEDSAESEEGLVSATPDKVGLAVIGSAVLGLSNLLGHVSKGL